MKKIYILPSLLTTGNLFCGVYALIMAVNGRFVFSSQLIIISIFFDFLDGQVARMKKASTKFGFEYDSLSDIVSFGITPAMILYQSYLREAGRIGVGLVFIYVVCAALRLARYNSSSTNEKKMYFSGLPTPAAAGFIATGIIFSSAHSFVIWSFIIPLVMLMLSFLMVSTFKYPSAGVLNLGREKPFLNLVMVILCFTMILFQVELFLFLCALIYVSLGMIKIKSIEQNVVASVQKNRA